MITNEDVVINGKLIEFKFIESDSLVDGPAIGIYYYNDEYYKVPITVENINPPIKAFAHWADDKAELLFV